MGLASVERTTCSLHAAPQAMRSPETVPPPDPLFVTFNGTVSLAIAVNAANGWPPWMSSDAALDPRAFGTNCTDTVHDAPAASALPEHGSAAMTNSFAFAPPTVTVSAALAPSPVFDTTNDCVPLAAPTAVAPKTNCVGKIESAGPTQRPPRHARPDAQA